MWMSEDDIEMATASTPQSSDACTSETTARFQARMLQFKPNAAIAATAAFSSPPMTGMPASI
jgi:hypothetical protein